MAEMNYKLLSSFLVIVDTLKEYKFIELLKSPMLRSLFILDIPPIIDMLDELRKNDDECSNFMKFVSQEMNEKVLTIQNILVQLGINTKLKFSDSIVDFFATDRNYELLEEMSVKRKCIRVDDQAPATKEFLKITSKEELSNIVKSYNIIGSFEEILSPLYLLYCGSKKLPEYFQLTEESYEKLKKDGLPEDILRQLKSLQNRFYTNETYFVKAIKKAIWPEQNDKYKSAILKSAKLPNTLNSLNQVCFSQKDIKFPQKNIKKLKEVLESLHQDRWLKPDSLTRIHRNIVDELSSSSKGFRFIISKLLENNFKENNRSLEMPHLDFLIANLVDLIRNQNGDNGYKLVDEFLYEQEIPDSENPLEHNEIKRRYKGTHETIRDIIAKKIDITKFILHVLEKIFSKSDSDLERKCYSLLLRYINSIKKFQKEVKKYSENHSENHSTLNILNFLDIITSCNTNLTDTEVKKYCDIRESFLNLLESFKDMFDVAIYGTYGHLPFSDEHKKVLLDEFDKA